MVLSMPSPYKHPSTGVYWYRQRVPARLKSIAKGKSVTVTIDGYASCPTIGDDIKVSLRTKTPADAKRLAPEAQAEFDRIWLSFENGPVTLTLRQIVGLAGEMYHTIRKALEDDPREAGEWAERRRQWEANDRVLQRSDLYGLMIKPLPDLRSRLGSWVDGALAQHHLTVTQDTYERLLLEFDRAASDIADLLEKRAKGDFSPDITGSRFPTFDMGNAQSKVDEGGKTKITGLLSTWAGRLKQPKPQTVIRYTGIITQLVAYLGHDDADRLTDADIVRWHSKLIEAGAVSHETFIKAYRAAISTVYAYGMTAQGGKLVVHNPAAKLLLEGPRKKQSRPKSFYVEEAHSILRCALDALTAENSYSEINRSAMRWVPWICAYTGARAGEVCQLRKQDFVEIDGIQCIALLPDAGTIKTGQFRYVPLHPHLIEQGLWKFAGRAKAGPLFFNCALKSKQPWVQTVQLLGEWVRSVAGVTDPRIGPNHAWRHWFKSKGRTAGIDNVYLDAICGHSLPTQGNNYGEFEPSALLREICKLPPIEIKTA
ncbi:UNVERIFIED_ORG: integrase [Rhizobium sp. SORGH_AS260]|nr:integrase [Rhizobium sp. SORGH_AS_0285]MDP9756044.1 integrase [Rhizobium sp. SORGH_AS_0260]MDR6081293.1 integrase [Agrobacterium sp. SORGH_AS_0440]